MPDGNTGIGAAVRRKEDSRFLRGKGNYTDDINRPNQTYAYFLRSSVALIPSPPPLPMALSLSSPARIWKASGAYPAVGA